MVKFFFPFIDVFFGGRGLMSPKIHFAHWLRQVGTNTLLCLAFLTGSDLGQLCFRGGLIPDIDANFGDACMAGCDPPAPENVHNIFQI